MAIDFSRLVYAPAFTVFARPVTFTPLMSQPGSPAFTGRGIFSTQPQDILTENGNVFSDHMTILDILEIEFATLPAQGDRIVIPAYLSLSALGAYEVLDVTTNGGGETTLSIRKVAISKP